MMAWPLLSSSNWMLPRCKTLAITPKRFCGERGKRGLQKADFPGGCRRRSPLPGCYGRGPSRSGASEGEEPRLWSAPAECHPSNRIPDAPPRGLQFSAPVPSQADSPAHPPSSTPVCTSVSLSAKSMTAKAFRTVLQSLRSLMEATLAQPPWRGEETGGRGLGTVKSKKDNGRPTSTATFPRWQKVKASP